jgi:hypothetical protein
MSTGGDIEGFWASQIGGMDRIIADSSLGMQPTAFKQAYFLLAFE